MAVTLTLCNKLADRTVSVDATSDIGTDNLRKMVINGAALTKTSRQSPELPQVPSDF